MNRRGFFKRLAAAAASRNGLPFMPNGGNISVTWPESAETIFDL